MNSRKAAVRIAKAGRIRNDVRVVPIARMTRCAVAPGDGAPGRCHDPEAVREQDREHDDPGRVQDRRERVEQEPPVGDEDLAERDRRREHDLRQAVDPQELDVQVLGRRIEALADDAGQPRCGDEDRDAGDGHQADGAGQHRPAEVVRRLVALVVPEPAVDRHERRGQAGRDEDVEGDLGDPEGRVVGVELGAGPVRVGEDPVADDPGREVGERQDRQQDRPAREDPVEQGSDGRDDGGQRRAGRVMPVRRLATGVVLRPLTPGRAGPGVACRGSWPRARAAMTASATPSWTSTSEKPSLIWIAPTTPPGTCASLVMAPTRSPGRSPARRPPPTKRRTHGPLEPGRSPPRGGPPGPPAAGAGAGRSGRPADPAPAGTPRRRSRDQRRREQLDLVGVLRAGALDEADRGERDVDEVELVGQRLDDAAEPVVAVAQERLAQVRAEDLGPPLAQVGDGRQLGDLELRVRRRLDVAQHPVLARLDQGDRHALAAGTPGPPDAMDVGVGVRRDVVVDDVRDVLDVETARGDVGRDQDVERAVAEAAHHPVAALLGQAAVEGAGVVAARAEGLGQVVDLAAGPREDQRRGRVLDVEDAAQGGQLVVPPDDVGDLADPRGAVAGDLLGVDLDPRRVAQVALGDARDGRRDRGREERRLALARGRRQDRLEVLGEAHVEHLVGLVEDDDLDAVEAQAAALEVVDRPARRRDDDVDAAPQPAQLLADRLAAVDRQDPGTELAAVLVERLGDLHRQLAGRDQDERRRAAFAGLPDRDALEGRQREGGGLAGPGRRLGEEVAAGEQRRDGLALDRRRLLVAEAGDRRQQPRVELEGRRSRRCRRRRTRRRRRRVDGAGGVGLGLAFRHVGHCRRVGGAQRAPAIGSRSIVRTRRVPPASVRTAAVGMTPATRRSMVASSPAYRPVPLIRTRPPTLRFSRPAPAVMSIATRFGRTIATSGPAPARGAPLVCVRATG